MDYRIDTNVLLTNEEKRTRYVNNKKIIVKEKYCEICGKLMNMNGFCNSHCIPKFILTELQYKGRLLNINSILRNDIFGNIDIGKNNVMIFHSICRECDAKMFQLYENKSTYEKINDFKDVSQELLFQIKYKNLLYGKYHNKWLLEKFKELCRNGNKLVDVKKNNSYINYYVRLGQLRTIRNQIHYKKELLKKIEDQLSKFRNNCNYKVVYFRKINYKIGFAFQGDITIETDMKWNILSNEYKENPNYEFLTYIVFPFNKFSIILIFCEENVEYYDLYFKQLNLEPFNIQLKRIVFDIFTRSEDVYLYNGISKHNLDSLEEIAAHWDLSVHPNMKKN